MPYTAVMKYVILSVLLTLPLSTFAQEDGEISEGFSLMEEGARLLFRGLIDEVGPSLDDFADMAQDLEPALEALASEMGPALVELFQTLDSIRHYEAPEILPNGDIIIRRRPDAPIYTPQSEDGVIDL